ncbi:MAG: UDP-glucuronic acid decarboxylase family protein [Candidatus Micrarchaeia archaeon]|jgi:UDP-glucuronate decarboxylase
MKILITGGAGFIGSNLCESLCVNHEVVCMDNFLTGRKENISGLSVEFVNHDVRKPFDLKCDVIFNMASPASPVDYQNLPLETLETNAYGIKNVLENAKRYGARVLQASTSEIYGDPLEHPQKEEYWGNVNTLGPRACYDESKRLAETVCYNYHQKFGVEIVLARIFNTYGKKMRKDDGRVIPNFAMQALAGKDLTIYGDGNQTRSFCHVDDNIKALEKLAFSDIEFDVFNVGNPDEYSLKQLANEIISVCGSKSKIVYKELPQDDPKRRKPDISKIRRAIGWEPKIGLKDGLKKTMEWFRKE